MNLLKYYSNIVYDDFFVKDNPKSRTHLVTIDKQDKTVHCDCEDFKFRKENLEFGGVTVDDKENHCKHIRFALRIKEVVQEVIDDE